MVSFSAKDLCCRSCMQIKMFNEYPDLRPKPNSNILVGQSFQHTVASTIDGLIGEEMRGFYIKDDICINFSNDIVANNQIIEVKSVDKERETEDWYFKSSLLQTAVYKALLMSGNGRLVTSTFFIEQGNPKIETKINNDVKYRLLFGDEAYEIQIKNVSKITNFIIEKAKSTLSWDKAKLFDSKYKHNEFNTLRDCFDYIITDIKS